MKLAIPRGMAPAAVVDRPTSRYRCRPCAQRSERIVLVVDQANTCVDCGDQITTAVEGSPQGRPMAHAGTEVRP